MVNSLPVRRVRRPVVLTPDASSTRSRSPRFTRSARSSDTRADAAEQDRGVRALIAVRASTRRQRTHGSTKTGSKKNGGTPRRPSHDDRANGCTRETLLAGVGPDRDLIAGEAREAARAPHPGLIFEPESIVYVDPTCEVLKRLARLRHAERGRQQHEKMRYGDPCERRHVLSRASEPAIMASQKGNTCAKDTCLQLS